MKWFVLILYVTSSLCTVTTLFGGEVSINGAVTANQIDIFVNFTANVRWLALIWSQDETGADVNLFEVDSTNSAKPVSISDMYLDQNSYIQLDFINNIQPSVTAFGGDISNGLSVAYSRMLNTGDTQDIILYSDTVIQVCFIASTVAFVGGGAEKGNEKSCTYLSLHSTPNYFSDRLLGRFAATTTFGGGNLTLYATQSTDGIGNELWLFVSLVHKGQGLNPFSGKWITLTYRAGLSLMDAVMIVYQRQKGVLTLHTDDSYIVNSSYILNDTEYVVGQGSNDVVNILGGYSPSNYIVASIKRKYSTGDVNRDEVITGGNNNFCFIYGDSLTFKAFVQPELVCLNFTLTTQYTSNFRQVAVGVNGITVVQYQKPPNSVNVVKAHAQKLIVSLCVLFIFL